MEKPAKRLLLDSAAVLNDFSFHFQDDVEYYTTPHVLDEFKDFRSKHLAENALKQGRLKLVEPLMEFMQQAILSSAQHRIQGLSVVDQSLLAVALQWNEEKIPFELVSDDFAVHAFCKKEHIAARSVMRKPHPHKK